MNKLYVLVGLPGSGKTWTANRILATDPNAVWISSDAIREELWGDANDQQNPSQVFGIMLLRTTEALMDGKNPIYDATNLIAKTRTNLLKQLKSTVAVPFIAECWVVATKISECKARQSLRDRKVPDEVIDRMVRQFQTPWYNEGWDKIRLENNGPKYRLDIEHIKMNAVAHDNPHHTSSSLNAHCVAASAAFAKWSYCEEDDDNTDGIKGVLREAIYHHDIGKLKTKVFHDTKGNPTDIAHYYSHENMGAYMWLASFEADAWDEFDALLIAALIQWHMQPYFVGNTVEGITDWCVRKGFGVSFAEWLWIVHKADAEGH